MGQRIRLRALGDRRRADRVQDQRRNEAAPRGRRRSLGPRLPPPPITRPRLETGGISCRGLYPHRGRTLDSVPSRPSHPLDGQRFNLALRSALDRLGSVACYEVEEALTQLVERHHPGHLHNEAVREERREEIEHLALAAERISLYLRDTGQR